MFRYSSVLFRLLVKSVYLRFFCFLKELTGLFILNKHDNQVLSLQMFLAFRPIFGHILLVSLPILVSTPAVAFTNDSEPDLVSLTRAFGNKNLSAAFYDAECPTNYKTLGGNVMSDPTAVTFKDKVYVFVKGIDRALYYQVQEKGKVAEWKSLGGNFISDPASYFNDQGLFVELTGTDNQRYHITTADGVTFSEWKLGSVKALTTTPTTVLKGIVFKFVKGKGSNPPICVQRTRAGILADQLNLMISQQNLNQKATPPARTQNNQRMAGINGGGMAQMMAPGGCIDFWDPACDCYLDPWAFGCDDPPDLSNQYSPTGWFDWVDTNSGNMAGWSYDPDHPSVSNDIWVSFDGPMGVGAGYYVSTDQLRTDVNAAFGITGNHGFLFSIPQQYRDGQQHTVYVYGMDVGTNPYTHLAGSPKTFTINPPPPPAPTWGTIQVISQTQLDVYWNAVVGATAYNIKMDGNVIASNFGYVSIPITNLAPGSTHTFEVQAVNQWGTSAWSSPLSGTTLPPVMPAVPTWGTVNTISETQLDVYWNAAANATAYNIRMNGNVIASNFTYISIPVQNLAPGTSYAFEVQGVNQYGTSDWSSVRTGTTLAIQPPTITSVTANPNPTCLDLVLNPVSGAASYNVKVLVSGYTINVTQTSFPWCGLVANTYFEFQAQTVTALGTSAWSAAVGGTTGGANPTPTPTPQPGTKKLSKEYIYSGSRQLAVEDYGITITNLALGKTAQQSSTWEGLVAGRAADGNTDGHFNSNSITHTGNDPQAWWEVDLGQLRQINTIKLWNRTDCCPERLSNFYVIVSDTPFASTNLNTILGQSGVSAYQITNTVNGSLEIPINRSGRYVRVQLIGQNYLSLAEVQVFGVGN